MPNFQDILNQTVESVERPPLPPLGHYELVVSKVPIMTSRGQYDIIEFPMGVVQALDDVDPDDLKKYGSLKKVFLRKSFLFDREDEVAFATTHANLKDFLEKHLGIEETDVPLKQALNAAVNKKCVGQLRYRADKNDPEIQYPELGRTAPLAD